MTLSRFRTKFFYRYIVLYCTTFLYFYLFYDCGINHWDEGIGANGALRLLQGDTVGIDFLAYAPGRYYLFYSSFYFFGINLLSVRRIMVVLSAFMPLLGYLTAKEVMNNFFAILTFFLILSAPSVYYNRFYPLFTLVNLYFITRFIKKGEKASFLWLLISIGVTFLFRIEIAVITCVCLCISLIFIKHIYGYALIGKRGIICFSLVIFIVIIYMFLQENVINYFTYRFYTIFHLHEKWGNSFPPLNFSDFITHGRFFIFNEVLLFYLPLPTYFFTLGLSFFNSVKRKDKKDAVMVLISLFGIGTFGLVIWRAGFDNLLRVLPPFYIAVCFVLSLCYDTVKSYFDKTDKNIHLAVLKQRVILVVLLIFPFLHLYNFSINHGFYAGSIGALINNNSLLSLPQAQVYTTKKEAESINQIVSFIKNETQKDDYIFSVPLHPLFYFLSGRKNPTFYEWILPGSLLNGDDEQNKIVNQLRKKKPKVIVLSNIAIDQMEERRFSNYADIIFTYITNNYELITQVGIFSLMRLNDG